VTTKPQGRDESTSKQKVKATDSFRWSHVHGDVVAENITAVWENGAWSINASKGSAQRAHYQLFQLRIPAPDANTPIKHQFIAEPGFKYYYVWNKPTQHDDFQTISINMEGYVHVSFVPSRKTFDGSFHYLTPRQSNIDIEGDGTFDFAIE
jgi:hypothetical protein